MPKPSAKAVPWLLFAAGGTVVAFILPVMIVITSLGPAVGLFESALQYETMHGFISIWPIRIILFGIIALILWHAAHRLRVCAHDLGIRADAAVAWILYCLAGVGTLATAMALLLL